jgi:hypothetical protein
VKKDPQAKQASMWHVVMLQQSPLVMNIGHIRLSTFFTKQHHFIGGVKFGQD